MNKPSSLSHFLEGNLSSLINRLQALKTHKRNQKIDSLDNIHLAEDASASIVALRVESKELQRKLIEKKATMKRFPTDFTRGLTLNRFIFGTSSSAMVVFDVFGRMLHSNHDSLKFLVD
jgi:hypothetical protein